MTDDDAIYGNFDDCPKCHKTVIGLHLYYDADDSKWIGELKEANTFKCPHCGAELALVTEYTHRLMLWSDAR